MNRLNATIIKHNETIIQALIEAKLYYEEAEPCPQLNAKVLFIEGFPLSMLSLNPIFIENDLAKPYVCYVDNGTEEVRVVNNDYKNYALGDLYEGRSGKYDIINELI